MPNPKKFKNEKEWMSACMPLLLHVERKKRDQAISQCLNMWRQRKKKARKVINNYIKGASIDMGKFKDKEATQRVLSAFLEKESERALRPVQIKKQIKEEKEWKKNLDKKVTPLLSPMPTYKEGEMIEILMDGKFVEVPYSKELVEQKFYYLRPKTRELVQNQPVHG